MRLFMKHIPYYICKSPVEQSTPQALLTKRRSRLRVEIFATETTRSIAKGGLDWVHAEIFSTSDWHYIIFAKKVGHQ